jgi:hypothetical protein
MALATFTAMAGCSALDAISGVTAPVAGSGVVAADSKALLRELLDTYKAGGDISAYFVDDATRQAAEPALAEWKSIGGTHVINEEQPVYDKVFAAQHPLAEGEGFINFMGGAADRSVSSLKGWGTCVFTHDEAAGSYVITFLTFDENASLSG